jgi:uncharacterized alpha/beta hydrolase family protein
MKKVIVTIMILLIFSTPLGVPFSIDDGDIGDPKSIIVVVDDNRI